MALLGIAAVLSNLAAIPLPDALALLGIEAAYCGADGTHRPAEEPPADRHAGCHPCCAQGSSAPPLASAQPPHATRTTASRAPVLTDSRPREPMRWASTRARAPPAA